MPAVAQYRKFHKPLYGAAALCVTLCAVPGVAAATERSAPQPNATVVAAADFRPSVEVNTSSLPRFDGADGATRSNRVDVTVLPAHALGMGFAVGVSSHSGFPRGFAPSAVAAPTVDFGLRWHYTLDSSYRFNITAYRRVLNTDALSLVENSDPSYGARVEMGMGVQNLRKGFVADRGFVGLQLEGGGKVTVRGKHGGPMFYYRNQF
jgi:hypothetical protein